MNIEFVSLKQAYLEQKSEIDSAVQKVLENGNFILGKEVEILEREFADYCEAQYCCTTDNGMSSIEIALRAAGVGEGDEVIVPANTFIGSVLPITAVGAKPVLVDVVADSFLIDLMEIHRAITRRTKCIMPVYLFGQMADADALWNIARDNKIFIIEDACQAHGANYEDMKPAYIGAAACFSFYPAKNFGCAGDGGCLVTNNKMIYDKAREYRNYGSSEKYFHSSIGTNARLDTLQAAILSVKLKKLDEWNDRRIAAAKRYSELLDGVGDIIAPTTENGRKHVYHLYVIKTHFRDKLQEFLKDNGIPTQIHYPVPIHKQKCYPEFNKLSFPVTEKLAKTMLSLPMHPHLTAEQIEFICDKIKEFFSQKNFYGEHKHSTTVPFDV